MISRSVLVLVLLVACGGGGGDSGGDDVTPFIGVYATMSHTRAEMPGGSVSCTDPGQPITSAAPFFRLAVDTFFMDPSMLSLGECTDAAGTDCTDTFVTLRAGGPGLQDETANSQTGGGVMCQLYFTHIDATLSGAMIQIQSLDKFDAPNIASSDCTLQRAQALASSPNCRTVERWTGARQ
jgi:hypothetical protein